MVRGVDEKNPSKAVQETGVENSVAIIISSGKVGGRKEQKDMQKHSDAPVAVIHLRPSCNRLKASSPDPPGPRYSTHATNTGGDSHMWCIPGTPDRLRQLQTSLDSGARQVPARKSEKEFGSRNGGLYSLYHARTHRWRFVCRLSYTGGGVAAAVCWAWQPQSPRVVCRKE